MLPQVWAYWPFISGDTGVSEALSRMCAVLPVGLLPAPGILAAGQEFTCQEDSLALVAMVKASGPGTSVCALWMPRTWVGVMSGHLCLSL